MGHLIAEIFEMAAHIVIAVDSRQWPEGTGGDKGCERTDVRVVAPILRHRDLFAGLPSRGDQVPRTVHRVGERLFTET